MDAEKVVCAAIWYKDIETFPHGNGCTNIDKGVVVCGLRHGNCIGITKALTNKRTVTHAEDGVGEVEQGFITTRNRYVSRQEAWEIAEREGQILRTTGAKGTLYSEDIY